MNQKILVTGTAGFIGFHLTSRLLKEGHRVTGIDSMNNYYNLQLKRDRLSQLVQQGVEFIEMDICNREALFKLCQQAKFDRVIHLAAQAGVRYSLTNPFAYSESNLTGFLNILEACRHSETAHLVYASSSSVYGLNRSMPFSTHHPVDHPVSLYGATKKANELMAHSYASMYQLPVTGLRFFTVYGPWGRPDMALFIFAKAIMEGKPVKVYNHGQMSRDFTYVDDIVAGIVGIKDLIASPNPDWNPYSPDAASSTAPYRVFNIGGHHPVQLSYFIELIENRLQRKAEKELLPMQVGDVLATYADIEALEAAVGFGPKVSIEEGVVRAIDWYLEYRQSNTDV